MTLFLKKKKQLPKDDLAQYGFSFANQPLTTCSDRVLSCALKGLFIFAAVYGTLGGLISSFDLPCYPVVLPIVLLTLSMAMAFLHYSRLIFNLFYPFTFIIFTFSIFTYRFYVYSGFQAFLNIMQEKYSTYFNLSILREANEYFSNRSMTITTTSIFIGFFLIVLLNIAISEYMNLPAVILLTFPIFQLGIYVDEMPDFPYLILLLFAYFMTAIMKRSGHFLLPYRDKVFTEFSIKQKKNTRTWRYHASGRMMLQLTVIFFLFSIFLGIFCLPFLSASSANAKSSDLRKKADEYVQIFTQNGLAGFFNRYEATGGISSGRLGGISSVRPDYETDLVVTFSPFAYETLYLKAYVGQDYDGNSWKPPSYNTEILKQELGINYEDFESYTAFLEARRLAHYAEKNPKKNIHGKIRIKNIDAAQEYLYLPYYATGDMTTKYKVERGLPSGVSPLDESYSVDYYPLMFNYWDFPAKPDAMLADLDPDSLETKYIAYYDAINTSSYIDMPVHTREGLEEIKQEIGNAANINEQVIAIQHYLWENYTYSMMPGTTPRNADFALHFLQEQDSGYCAHFATAGTLLLRSYGIPARYVEGYVVTVKDVAEGTLIDEPYEEWFQGTNPLGENAVVSVNVTDANAHAWVEVYMPGIGWVPREFTPPDTSASDSEDTYSNFWSILSGIFGGTPPEDTSDNMDTEQNATTYTETFFGKSSFLTRPLLMFAGAILLLLIIIAAGRRITTHMRMTNAYRCGDYAPLLSLHYRKLCNRLIAKRNHSGAFILPTDLPALLSACADTPERRKKLPPYTEEASAHYMELLEICLYSEQKISKKEADALLQFLKKYKKWI